MADWSELKRLAEAATPGPWGRDGSYICPARTEDGTTYIESWRAVADAHDMENVRFIAAANPAAILELIAENEEMARRIRFFELVHGGRASELVCEMEHLRAEVRRLKILAGEDVPPLPEEFVGPMPENCYARLRRKLRNLNDAPKVPASLVFPPIEEQSDQLRAENERLRQIISDSATACGAAMSPECTAEFMGHLPAEIAGVLGQLRAELERVRAEGEALRKHLAECADSLESEILDRYGSSKDHPAMRRKFERDMQEVIDARAAMGKGGKAHG